jgi:hypothetical protein
MAAAASVELEHKLVPQLNCAIPFIPISGIFKYIDTIIDNLQTMEQLLIPNPNELSINVVSFIIGSYASKVDFENPSNSYSRNHECTSFACNLLQNPVGQLSPSFLEYARQSNTNTININQYMFLIDPMYSKQEHAIPHGLASKYPSIMYNPIISVSGFIMQDNLLPSPIAYNSILEPCIIPEDIDEKMIQSIIERFQTIGNGKILINLMDCTSYVLRKMWVENNIPNIYLATPDCLARDNTPMYMPVITYSSPSGCADKWSGCRWINWNLDKDMATLYQLISPHTYEFIIHNYKRIVLETYFMPICKILSRMRVTKEYKFQNGTAFRFDKMSFLEFRHLWNHVHVEFRDMFISYMDEYYKWNYYKFISILLKDHSITDELSMQKILLGYLEAHLQQLKVFFPLDSIPDYTNNETTLLPVIYDYLHENNIH